jgi:hypothetical protein
MISEQTYITSDNDIYFYPGQQGGFDTGKVMSMTSAGIEMNNKNVS